MSIIRKIKDYYKRGLNSNLLFTTPSHSQGNFIPEDLKYVLGQNFYNSDFSEIEGFDNLRNPSGIIKDILDKLTEVYKSKRTFLLTNGSTSGILAAVLSLLKDGDLVLTARNCHISVCNAFILSGATPVWLMPEYNKQWDIYTQVNPEQIELNLKKNPGIKAVILTSPTYEGIFSDISAIAQICKKYGVFLIVDEAHGALLNFGAFKSKPAILCGADISIQSLHKTAGAPNPCALLHISKNSSINPETIQSALNLINTTSPSYPLMAAVEGTVDYLNSQAGRIAVENLLNSISDFKTGLNENITCYEGNNDTTKILLKFKGKSGFEVSEVLNNKYNIEEEFSNNLSMLFITGIGTDKDKLYRLSNALNSIAKETADSDKLTSSSEFDYVLPKPALPLREAYFCSINQENITKLNAKDALGKISAQTLTAYPPGIPIIMQGEIINTQTIKLAEKLLNHTVFAVFK